MTKEEVVARVFRYDPLVDDSPRYEAYRVPYKPKMRIMEVLEYIREHYDCSLSYRWSCRRQRCGSCALQVDGKPALACLVACPPRGEVVIEPLPNFPVIKDLVIGRSKVERKLLKLRPFVERTKPPSEKPERFYIPAFSEFKEVRRCTQCLCCVGACPVVSGEHWGTFAGPLAILQMSTFSYDIRDTVDRAKLAFQEGLYDCTTCNICKEVCPWDINIATLAIQYLRQLQVEKGVVPRNVKAALVNTHKYGNPWKGPIDKRDEWAKDLKVKNYSRGEKAEILYFIGCTSSYDTRAQEIARSMVLVLGKAGVDFGILGNEERCCGAPILRLGEKGLFDMLVEENLKLFEKYDINRIVTGSPHSYNAFLNDYPKKGLEVQHYTQLLSDLIDQGKINFSKKVDMVVTYHDPCFLGRYNDVYEAPRKILEAIPGLTLVEMPRNRENSFCCGGGGGMMWTDETQKRLSAIRAREAASLEPDIIATTCPFCLISLEDGVKTIEKDDRIQVKDIAELLKDAM